MDPYMSAINAIIDGAEFAPTISTSTRILAFSTLCAVIGLMCVILDLLVYMLRGKSTLKLDYGRSSALIIVSWTLGAAFIGALGQLAEILRLTTLACVTVGLTWPLIFTQLLEDLARRQQDQEPEQPITAEC